MTRTTEVASAPVVYQGAPLPLSQEARKLFSEDTVALLASKIGMAANVASINGPLLYSTLELAARYGLDPFAGEIWLAKMGGRDGGGGSLVIMVGRDGYMKVAKRDRAFISCAGQAVYEHDELSVEIDITGGLSAFHFKAAHPAKRGGPLGAFAILARRGDYPPLYFFAPLEQFKKGGGAWKYEDAMIVKCAQSYLLRTTYNISGATPFDEVSVGFDPNATDSTATEIVAVLPEPLEGMLARAIDVDPKSWKRNEVEARVLDVEGKAIPGQVRKVQGEMAEWLEENDRDGALHDLPPRAEPPEEIVDAEVVEPVAERPLMSREAIAAKWEAEPDSEWRRDVETLLRRRDELEEMPVDLAPDELEQVGAELDFIAGKLEQTRGVPRGWQPPVPGQASLI